MLGLCTAKQWPGKTHSVGNCGEDVFKILIKLKINNNTLNDPPPFCPPSHYMRQILEALRYCHDNNVIHRDVKVRCVPG